MHCRNGSRDAIGGGNLPFRSSCFVGAVRAESSDLSVRHHLEADCSFGCSGVIHTKKLLSRHADVFTQGAYLINTPPLKYPRGGLYIILRFGVILLSMFPYWSVAPK